MIGNFSNIAQAFPLDQVKHEVAGAPGAPVQAGTTQALSNATVANIGGQDVKGYGLDFNNDGQFGRNDGVLTFDMNNDGKNTGKEIADSRQILDVLSGNRDLDHDGKVGGFEGMIADKMKAKFEEKYNTDGQAGLSQQELQQAGARVLTDQNGDGKFESNTVNNVAVNTPGGPGVGQITGVGGGMSGLAPAGPPQVTPYAMGGGEVPALPPMPYGATPA